MSALKKYLEDPFLKRLYDEIREAGPVRSISVDITSTCNLRCTGCYYFEEGMDAFTIQNAENVFDDFIEFELKRGTNFVTVVGGEPSLALDRLKKIYDNFKLNVATNGLIKIPVEGFENMPIGIAVWGDHNTDSKLRGNGKRDYFSEALRNYYMDDRAFWYYTVAPGSANEIENVVRACITNGNKVLFNYYSDVGNRGGLLDYRQGFDNVQHEIDRMIDLFPGDILTTSYFNEVTSTGKLYDQKWGYDVCTNVSTDNVINERRLQNGNPYNAHFRAINADFQTTRRCCTGISRSCDSCFDTWEHFSWIMIYLKKHLNSEEEFTNWLSIMYVFYTINRLVDYKKGLELLPQIHHRLNSQVAI